LGGLESPGPTGVNIIAEIKRASPSKGLIRPDLDPAQFASAYEKGGAAAISVLTDQPGFRGTFDDLVKVRQSVSLPVLRKDFLISSYQLYESLALGADAVLLIVRILAPAQFKDYLSLCGELGLAVLVEVHSAKEIEIATRAGAKLIGINNRNLSSFQTSIETAADLVPLLEDDQVAVAESGIHCREDVCTLIQAGIFNFLIGESLVRSENPEEFLAVLRGAK
jgi:indole-3-glycerol phosphate synthase